MSRTPSSVLLFLALSACGLETKEQDGPAHVARFSHAESEDLVGLYATDLHYAMQHVYVHIDADDGSGILEYDVLDPAGLVHSSGEVTIPGETIEMVPTEAGAWTVVASAARDSDLDDSALREGFLVSVAPEPSCDELLPGSLTELSWVEPSETFDLSSTQLGCIDEYGNDAGEVPEFTVTAVQGGYFNDDPEQLDCALPDGSCELTITGVADLRIEAEGWLMGASTGEPYELVQRGSFGLPLAFPPVVEAGWSKDDPTVATDDLSAWIELSSADDADLSLEWVVTGYDRDGLEVYYAASEATELVISGDGVSLDLPDLPMTVGAGGEIVLLATAFSADGVEESFELSVEVAPLELFGHADWPQIEGAFVAPIRPLDFSGPWQFRAVVHPWEDERTEGLVFSAVGPYAHFVIDLSGDSVVVDVHAPTWDGDWEDRTLEASFDRLGGERIPQELRVSAGLDSLSLIIDGQVRDQVEIAYDYRELEDASVEIGAVPLLMVDSVVFLPGHVRDGVPWATPCTSSHLAGVDGAWCEDWNELEPGDYANGSTHATTWGGLRFEGRHEVVSLEEGPRVEGDPEEEEEEDTGEPPVEEGRDTGDLEEEEEVEEEEPVDTGEPEEEEFVEEEPEEEEEAVEEEPEEEEEAVEEEEETSTETEEEEEELFEEEVEEEEELVEEEEETSTEIEEEEEELFEEEVEEEEELVEEGEETSTEIEEEVEEEEELVEEEEELVEEEAEEEELEEEETSTSCTDTYSSTPAWPSYTDETGYYVITAAMEIDGCTGTVHVRKGDGGAFSADGVVYLKDLDDQEINLASQAYSAGDRSVEVELDLCSFMPTVPDDSGVWVVAKPDAVTDSCVDSPSSCYWATRMSTSCSAGGGSICLEVACE